MGLLRHRLAAGASLAVTAVLAVGLLVIVVGRPGAGGAGPTPSAPASSGLAASASADWPATAPASESTSAAESNVPSQAATLPPLNLPAGWRSTVAPGQVTLAPVLAPSDTQIYMAGLDESRLTIVWTSSDGVTWQRSGGAGIDKDFVPRSALGDGNGGVFVAGELTSQEGAVVPQIWHSADGASFTSATVESFAPAATPAAPTASPDKAVLPLSSGEIVSIDGARGSMVAFGDHNTTDASQPSGVEHSLDVWHSTDGANWTHVGLTGSENYSAIAMTAWRGGFAALADSDSDKGHAVWLSADGLSWRKSADVAAFAASGIVAFGDRLVVVGSAQDSKWGMVPASFWSTDGSSWTEAVAPVQGYAAMFDAATVVGNRLVAIGTSHVGQAADASGAASPAASPTLALVPPTFWVSSDGSTWREDGQAPAYSPYMTGVAAYDGHVVVATAWIGGVIVSSGDLP
jgi:hypothetical protein